MTFKEAFKFPLELRFGSVYGFTWNNTKEKNKFWEEVITNKNFDHFYELYPKPTTSKFEVGKWYKTSAGSLVKYKNSNNNIFNASEHFMYDHLSKLQTDGRFGSINNKFEEVSIEEMQRYLPDGHPDKITNNTYKVGDEVIATGNVDGYENQKGTIVEINSGGFWQYRVCFESTKAKIWSNVHSLVKETTATDALLEEANRRFPIGSKFKCDLGGFKDSPDIISKRKDELIYCPLTNSISAKNERYVYFQGKWAELIKEIPEYVECTKIPKGWSITKVGNIYKTDSDGNGTYRLIFSDGGGQTTKGVEDHFKPSTKEAYEAQNSKTKVEEWSVGTYVVFTRDYGHSSIGDIDEIIEGVISNGLYCKKEGVTTKEPYTKWFATYEEAKAFSNSLKTSSLETSSCLEKEKMTEFRRGSIISPIFEYPSKDLFQIGNYAVCINDNANHSKGRVTEINYIINRDEFAGDNLRSNYKRDFKAFESMREANAFSNRLSKIDKNVSMTRENLERLLDVSINKPISNPCGEIPISYAGGQSIYPTKESIKTRVIPTNVIDIPLRTKKKKQLFTI